jgi:hypothetical protein
VIWSKRELRQPEKEKQKKQNPTIMQARDDDDKKNCPVSTIQFLCTLSSLRKKQNRKEAKENQTKSDSLIQKSKGRKETLGSNRTSSLG